jgi:hypothetical protein
VGTVTPAVLIVCSHRGMARFSVAWQATLDVMLLHITPSFPHNHNYLAVATATSAKRHSMLPASPTL